MEEINDIPQTIRDQIGSGKIIAIIDSINERAEIARLSLVSQVVYDLFSKDVLAKDFISHCSSVFKFNQKKMKAVVREIKEKILKQFDYVLLNYGIDIKEIDTSDSMTLDEYIKQHNEMLASIGIEVEKPVSTISLENFSDTEPQDFTPVKINVDGSVDNTLKKIEVTDEPAPLVIHREKPQAPTQKNSQMSGSSQQTKGFSLPFGFFKQKVVQTQSSSTPVKATIEFLKKDDLKRAVDYSELRTPLTPFSKKEENFIKTEEQKTQNSSQLIDVQPVTQKINPLTMFGNKQTIPTPEGSGLRPQGASEKTTNKGVLDIRGVAIDQNSNLKSQISNKIQNQKIGGEKIIAEASKPTITDVQKNITQPIRKELTSSAQGARPSVGQGPTQGSQTPPPSKSFSIPEKTTTPIISNTPIEQKNDSTMPKISEKGFVWFKKPKPSPNLQTPNNNVQKSGPQVEGNVVDLRSNT